MQDSNLVSFASNIWNEYIFNNNHNNNDNEDGDVTNVWQLKTDYCYTSYMTEKKLSNWFYLCWEKERKQQQQQKCNVNK